MKRLIVNLNQLLDAVVSLSKDLMLFLVEKGAEKAADNQQKVIHSLEESKHVNFPQQTTLYSTLIGCILKSYVSL